MLEIGRVNGINRATHIAVKDNEGMNYLIPRDKLTPWMEWRGIALRGDDPQGWNVPDFAKVCVVFSGKNYHNFKQTTICQK